MRPVRAFSRMACAWRWLLAVLPLIAMPSAQAGNQVFLLQNSGWMEPFFHDPNSPYRPLIAEVVAASTEPGDGLLLASFNQSQPGAPSPKGLLSTKVSSDANAARQQVAGALQNLVLAKKTGSTALADTDLNEAVSSAIHQGLADKPGLIWLFTNNKNSPNNDQATTRRNREFYQQIHGGSAISAALAWPLKMPLRGKQYQTNGLMLYVFAVGAVGAQQLQTLLASGRIQKILTEPAARLKPLDQDTVRLVPQRVENTPGVTFAITPGGVLQANVAPDAHQPQASIVWELQNRIYPYTIASANVSAQSTLAQEQHAVTLNRQSITSLTPEQGQPLGSSLQLPLAKLPGTWSLAALRAAGSAYVVAGQIRVQLSDQKLGLSPHFRERMGELFPGDPLPDIFTPPDTIHQSQAVLPLQVRVEYGLGPLIALLGSLAVLGAASVLGYAQAVRPRKVAYVLDGRPGTIQGRIGRSSPVFDWQGNQVAQVQFGWFGQQLKNVQDGVNLTLQ